MSGFSSTYSDAHECGLRTVTSWGCATFIHSDGCSVEGEWRERKNARNDRLGAEEKGSMPPAPPGWVGGSGGCVGVWVSSQTAKWAETHQQRKWERRLVFFQGGLLLHKTLPPHALLSSLLSVSTPNLLVLLTYLSIPPLIFLTVFLACASLHSLFLSSHSLR